MIILCISLIILMLASAGVCIGYAKVIFDGMIEYIHSKKKEKKEVIDVGDGTITFEEKTEEIPQETEE